MNKAAGFTLQLFLVSTVFAGEVFEDTIEKTVPLSAHGTFSLQAMDGSVEIYGAEGEEAKIVAIRKAFSPQRVNAIQIQIEAHSASVSVNTSAPPKPRWGWRDRSGTVDYIINLPQHARIASVAVPNGELVIHGMRGASIDASLGNGRLTSHNCFCDQKLRVQTGGLDLFFDWEEDRPISVEGTIVNGNARAVIPEEASFELHAATRRGHVASDFTEPAARGREGVSEIHQNIGSAPWSKLVLNVTQGNVRISETLW